MASHFHAIVARDVGRKAKASLERLTNTYLPDLDVLVGIDYSTLNYKDALAITGRAPICRRMPMVCGIDLAGVVLESENADWKKGDKVLVNGFGLSETHWGGYSQRQRLSAQWLTKRPKGMSSEHAMAIGTAGYTAMLCVNALRAHGRTPSDGPILVTGASGGVGTMSLIILAKLGFATVAVSGRKKTHDLLTSLGASKVIERDEFSRDCKPIEKEIWSGVIDSVGGKTLATVLAQTKYNGIVAACGLAGGSDLPGSVMPFILRGVTLRGIDSVMADHDTRDKAWRELNKLVKPIDIKAAYSVKPMSKVIELADDLLEGRLLGRVVVDVNS